MFKKLLGKFGLTTTNVITTDNTLAPDGYLLPQSASQLLSTELRQALINHIWQHTSLSRDNFQKIYLSPIERYAELVQQFPASESHHHAYLGGLLDHGLELVAHALKLRQSYLLPPGVPPEDQAVQGDAWTAAIAYGGLLHDIGKIAVDIEVELKDGQAWHPWLGSLNQAYRFRYIGNRDYQLHDVAVGLLCHHIIAPELLNWLSSYQELWSSFLHLVAGHYENAGVLGEIVDKADRVSTAKNIGANPEKAIAAPVNSLQKKLITGLRHLIKTQFTINKTPGNGWLTQDGLWLMSKTTADQLRAYLLSQGFDGIPSKNSILFDELQSYGIIQANPLDDRAIWMVKVSDNTEKWQQEFSLLKVNASLIWSGEDKPELFNGQIQVIQKEQTNAEADPELDNLLSSEESNSDLTNNLDKLAPITLAPVSNQLNDNHTKDDTDDMLALFDMDDGEITAAEDDLSTFLDNPTAAVELTEDNNVKAVSALSTSFKETTPPPPDNINLINISDTNDRLTFDFTAPMTKTSLGEMFIDWLKNRIALHKLKVNDKDAKLHLIDGRLFIVSPGIFKRFYYEYPEFEKLINNSEKEHWKIIQSSFEKLKLHVKRADDLNIWQCQVAGPRRKGQIIKGYLLEANPFFKEFIPNNNPFIELKKEDFNDVFE